MIDSKVSVKGMIELKQELAIVKVANGMIIPSEVLFVRAPGTRTSHRITLHANNTAVATDDTMCAVWCYLVGYYY